MAINKKWCLLALALWAHPALVMAQGEADWCHLDWHDGKKTHRAWFMPDNANCDNYETSSVTAVYSRPGQASRGDYFSGGVIVRFVRELSSEQVDEFFHDNGIRHFSQVTSMRGVYWADTPADISTLLVASRLAASPLVGQVTPNWRRHLMAR